jgi:hypothetical protein
LPQIPEIQEENKEISEIISQPEEIKKQESDSQ